VRLAAVIITYNPDDKFGERLTAIARECAKVFVVDNGSTNQEALRKSAKRSGVKLILLGQNTGIAHAQNVGISAAFGAGAEAVILFDHDSVPRPGFSKILLAAAGVTRIAGPRIYDVNRQCFALHPCYAGLFFRRRPAPAGGVLESAMMVIASGCLIPRAVYERVGGMRAEYFIDYVDWEYCLRARHKFGIKTVVAGAAVLDHSRGERRGRRLGPFTLYPPGYSHWRYEHIFRNRAALLREYLFKDRAFVAFEFVSLARDFLLLASEQKPFSLCWLAIKSWCGGFFRWGKLA
jgi:rhamnosyltransferase